MKNFILKWGDVILELNCTILTLVLTGFCFKYYDIYSRIALTDDAKANVLITSLLAWFIGMNVIVFSFYFVFSLMDIRNSLKLLASNNFKSNKKNKQEDNEITFNPNVTKWWDGIVTQFKKTREEQRHLTIKQAVYNWWNGKFEGRCPLCEYWVIILLLNLFLIILSSLHSFMQGIIYGFLGNDGKIIVFIVTIPICLLFLILIKPSLAMYNRRLKDLGISLGLFSLLFVCLCPIVNIVFFIILFFIPGNVEENEYGTPSIYYIEFKKLFTDWNTPIIEMNDNLYPTDYELYSTKQANSSSNQNNLVNQENKNDETNDLNTGNLGEKTKKEDLSQSISSLCKNLDEDDD